MKKRGFDWRRLWVLAAVLLLCVGAGQAAGGEEVLTSGEANIEGSALYTLRENGQLTISGTGPLDLEVSESRSPWLGYRDRITALVIEEGITSVNSKYFCSCPNLTSVTLPESLDTVEDCAFQNTPVERVIYPGSFAQLGEKISRWAWSDELRSAQWQCSGNQNVVTESGPCGEQGAPVTYQLFDNGDLVISGTGEMKNYDSGSSDWYAPWYRRRDRIGRVIVEPGVTSVGKIAFQMLPFVTSVSLPEGLTSIGYEAFYNCTKLNDVRLPSTLKTIDASAFFYCWALREISLPEGLTSMGAYCFAYCEELVGVTIPSTLTEIPARAFFGNNAAAELTIPGTVKTIGEDAFAGWQKLDVLTVEPGVESIGNGAFSEFYYDGKPFDWSDTRHPLVVTLPGTLAEIGNSAFYIDTQSKRTIAQVRYVGTREQWLGMKMGTKNSALSAAPRVYLNAMDDVVTDVSDLGIRKGDVVLLAGYDEGGQMKLVRAIPTDRAVQLVAMSKEEHRALACVKVFRLDQACLPLASMTIGKGA